MDQKDSTQGQAEKNKNQQSTSKGDQQKTPTREQKDTIKQEQQRIKNEQKAQQKLEKEQQKMEKEQLKHEKELQKEQLKLEKEQLKSEKSPSKNCFKLAVEKGGKDGPVLKTQKSIDVSTIKHQKSFEGPRPPARNSVDLQYTRDLMASVDIPEFASTSSLAKTKNKK